ncbi:MAG: exodeoxyribonuclease V subunit gamma [Candidatus Nanopelagicales bacterium]
MAWSIRTAPNTGLLVDALARRLAVAPSDPFTPEVVAVPTPGIERFIVQRLAEVLGASCPREGQVVGPGNGFEAAPALDGVCANVHFPSPAELVGKLLAAGSGLAPAADPWSPGRLVWHVLAAIDTSLDEPWAGPIRHHLRDTTDRPRADHRLALGIELSELFALYASQRPSLSLAWSTGLAQDGRGVALPERLRWQYELWRSVRGAVGVPDRAERLAGAVDQIRSGAVALDLPERLSLFGPTRMPADQLLCFAALAEAREVVIYLPDPSGARWVALAHSHPYTVRRDEFEAKLRRAVRHPLMRSLGRDSAEMQARLARIAPAAPVEHEGATWGDHLLGWLQADLTADSPPGAGRRALSGTDRSVRVHACHGGYRQVEVLREEILHALAGDPTLEPRDILVMCPDLAGFAPLVEAVLGTTEQPVDQLTAGLRVQVADRSPSLTNSVLVVLEAMLSLLAGRVTANELLDFVALPAVANRLRADDEDMARLRQMAGRAGARWGLHDRHRQALGLEGVGANTWSAAVARMLLGVAMGGDGLPTIGRVLPLDEIGSRDVELIGGLAVVFRVLCEAWEALTVARPLRDWVRLLQDWLSQVAEPPVEQRWDATAAGAVLNGLVDDSGPSADTLDLAAPELRLLITRRLSTLRPRSRFRAGGVTVSGLMPMRSVPYRFIALLGLDDGAFPRQTVASGDDVLALAPLVGERDPSSEDRHLLLEAVLAARDRLVITYTGADPRTNEVRPPAVPVAELLDALDATAEVPDGGRVRDRVVIRHPLQPTDEANFIAGRLGHPGPFSHEPTARRGALALREPPVPVATLADVAAQPPELDEVQLDALVRFWQHPVRGFLRTGLSLSAGSWDASTKDDLALEADSLQEWGLGNTILNWLEAGEDPTRVQLAALLTGDAPIGAVGVQAAGTQARAAERVHAWACAKRIGSMRSAPVDHRVPGGARIVGAVSGLYDVGLVDVTFSKAKPRNRLPIYLSLLVLAAATGQRPDGWLVHGSGTERLTLSDTPAQAAERVAQLVEAYRQGLARPLPLPLGVSWEWANGRLTGERRLARAAATWSGRFGEAHEEVHARVWGRDFSFGLLHAIPPPRRDTPGGSWFEELTGLLWGGLAIGREK